jgi:hypothetical protein
MRRASDLPLVEREIDNLGAVLVWSRHVSP